jgi:hypothetical protein
LYGRLGGPQNRSGRCGEKKDLAPAWNRAPGVQPVARLRSCVMPTPIVIVTITTTTIIIIIIIISLISLIAIKINPLAL